MSKEYVIVPKEDYVDTCDAIREKINSTALLKSNEMAQAVRDISTSAKEEQEKTVDITKNGTTEILPDEGKVLSKVTVDVDVPSSGGDYTDEQVMALINREITEFTVPDGTTIIGHSAFRACISLVTVNIPSSVTVIGANAFESCSKLDIVSLPDGVTDIGDTAFASISNSYFLTKLPRKLKTIRKSAFAYCGAFSISEIPPYVESIDRTAFISCTGLTELTFEGTPTSIATNSFQGCTNLINIYVPWLEGEVANAPWGATNATIHYNSEVSNAES